MTSTLPAVRSALPRHAAHLAAVFALSLAPGWVLAQTGLAPASPASPAPPASGADIPGRLRPTPKVTSPTDARRSLDLDNARPEGRVTPQLRIPLGKKKDDSPVLQRRPTDSTGTSSVPSGVIDDTAAKCDAERDPQVRAQCRKAPAR